MSGIALPGPFTRWLDSQAEQLMRPPAGLSVDFRHPDGAPALAAPTSVSWRIFKNPVTLFIGGTAAVILELAEPSVRAGVWDHTSFRTDPLTRLQRTGFAAMVTVYAPREAAERLIAGVNRAHDRVTGTTESGKPYRASDVDLLDWVQATASYGFLEAYHRYAAPLSEGDRDALFAEAAPAARLYGATGAPQSERDWWTLVDAMQPRLGPSPVIDEFLRIMRSSALMPRALRPLQPLLVGAAVDLVPQPLAQKLGLKGRGLGPVQKALVRRAGRIADRVPLSSAPPAVASVRMGHPPDWLYRR